jgi:nucleoside-diphosphate-sugar epimerase
MKQPDRGTVLVTGGTGFVGSHLVELLLARGYDVTCLVRDPARLRWLAGKEVRLVAGDCSDPDSLSGAVRGVSVVYHAAGLTKAFRKSDYYAVNRQGTRNVLEACSRHDPGLQKFVLVSSLAAAGPSLSGVPVTDRDEPHPVSDYGRSKLLAEAEALKFKDRFPVVIMRPSAVYGPRDTDVFELFQWAAKGFIIDLQGAERSMQWCYVGDVAEALLLAGERAVPSGSIYFAAEDRIYRSTEFHTLLQQTGGVSSRVIKVPVWAGYAIGALSEAAGAIRGRANIMNRQKVREAVQQAWTCDLAKTAKDLGFIARVPLEPGLELTWKWYREQKWIRS